MAIRKRTWESGGASRTAWVADYADQYGVRRLRTFPTNAAARRWWEDEGAASVREGTHTARHASKTVAEAGAAWLARCERGGEEDEPLERATVREYRGHLDRYINHPAIGIGAVKLADLDYDDVKAFLLRVRDAGTSAAMVRKIRTSLSALLSDAVEGRLVAKHAIRDGQRNRRRRHKDREARKIEMPTKDQLRAMIEAADDDFRPLLVTAIFTGMRISELRGLIWAHVDLEKGIIQVRQRADRFNAIGAPKSEAGNRDIPLAPMVKNTLAKWRLRCPRQGGGKGTPHYVFPTSSGTVQSLGNLYCRKFAPLQIRCGITIAGGRARFGFHALRHAAASLFIEQGFMAKKLQVMMGHSSIQMTFDTYGKLFPSPEDDARAMKQIQARLLG